MAKYNLGIDIGSTTAKIVLMDGEKIIYKQYRRHLSQVRQTTVEMLKDMAAQIQTDALSATISGSAGMGMAQSAGIDFIQEVYATSQVIKKLSPQTNVVIELGGEDAKVIFFDGGIDERMNGTCAGGTGSFIDQMAVLLDMTVDDMDKESLNATRIYPIASRCGVFAKTDIQPLLNQGANKADIAASIFQAVVNQTIAGLVQGRKITGKVMFLGGPLYYCKGLQKRFYETLNLTPETAVFPEYALYSVAMGAAMYSEKCKVWSLDELIEALEKTTSVQNSDSGRLAPLFENQQQYKEFCDRHLKATIERKNIKDYSGNAWLGIDCGSTTTKMVLIGEDKSILYTYYNSNKANPAQIVKEQLNEIYALCGDRIKICGSAVTGYGEELIKNAFKVDIGMVETIAHYTAAKYFKPDVDFILDIGGQDIKCFHIKNKAIDSIMLNEACSSGCGSFIETFAKAMGYSVAQFANLGITAKAPVNLGSRCTVFMNSSVKQSQKDGACVEDISAGLSISVVKNAIYKVIRVSDVSKLGKNIVVQGGTFYNDAVLRAFEKELGINVIRPSIAGLMGAFGAALYSMKKTSSTILTKEQLDNFVHKSTTTICKGCTNNCNLTINTFGDNSRFISGNRCEKPLGVKNAENLPNLYQVKREYLESLTCTETDKTVIGIPLALSTYELAPLWYAIFTKLGFGVKFSKPSNRQTYEKGQFTIPSDTICYPAKIMHGHILELIEEGVKTIFYPGLTKNIDEHAGDNHYNCPVVAYYSELLKSNIEQVKYINFLYPYLSLDSRKQLVNTLYETVKSLDGKIKKSQLKQAVDYGFEKYEEYKKYIADQGEKAIEYARKNNKRIMILAGRPYHIDPEICHGIDRLATSLGFVVVSEDSVCHLAPVQNVSVLDQWTFHARLYRAAKFATENDDVQLVQLVSFGCGVDAITTDEVCSILENGGKYYTQIKIDEITNLGAVTIRLRSLIGALEEKE